MRPFMRCVDVNSEQCPCLLSDTNHCFMCSQLKGEAVCNCDWTGQCILQEKRWKAPRKPSDAPCRREVEATLVIKQQINEHTYIVETEVGLELAEQLNKIGSFVFMRRVDDPEMCNFPVGIMDVKNGVITLAIETIGPKSSRLFMQPQARALLRGPYLNGVFGQPWIDSTKYGTILAAVGGLGQSNALMLAKAVLANGNRATFVIAPGQAGSIFVADELQAMGVEVISVSSMRREGFAKLQELFSDKVDLLLSAGPDDLHYGLIAAMHESGYNYPMAVTNNATMCCGEGICGSCSKKTKDGVWIRTCKIQLDFNQLENSH
ncbi:MAG: pyrK 1 [Anaerosporomusa subterranea]|nr:pyrK 1 [Anaerosporomusa subterranea]